MVVSGSSFQKMLDLAGLTQTSWRDFLFHKRTIEHVTYVLIFLTELCNGKPCGLHVAYLLPLRVFGLRQTIFVKFWQEVRHWNCKSVKRSFVLFFSFHQCTGASHLASSTISKTSLNFMRVWLNLWTNQSPLESSNEGTNIKRLIEIFYNEKAIDGEGKNIKRIKMETENKNYFETRTGKQE